MGAVVPLVVEPRDGLAGAGAGAFFVGGPIGVLGAFGIVGPGTFGGSCVSRKATPAIIRTIIRTYTLMPTIPQTSPATAIPPPSAVPCLIWLRATMPRTMAMIPQGTMMIPLNTCMQQKNRIEAHETIPNTIEAIARPLGLPGGGGPGSNEPGGGGGGGVCDIVVTLAVSKVHALLPRRPGRISASYSRIPLWPRWAHR